MTIKRSGIQNGGGFRREWNGRGGLERRREFSAIAQENRFEEISFGGKQASKQAVSQWLGWNYQRLAARACIGRSDWPVSFNVCARDNGFKGQRDYYTQLKKNQLRLYTLSPSDDTVLGKLGKKSLMFSTLLIDNNRTAQRNKWAVWQLIDRENGLIAGAERQNFWLGVNNADVLSWIFSTRAMYFCFLFIENIHSLSRSFTDGPEVNPGLYGRNFLRTLSQEDLKPKNRSIHVSTFPNSTHCCSEADSVEE